MSDMAPMNGQGDVEEVGEPQAPVDQTATVLEEVQELILWGADKAKVSQDGGEFQKWALGLSQLIGSLYPKGGEIGAAAPNDSAQNTGSGGEPTSQPSKGGDGAANQD